MMENVRQWEYLHKFNINLSYRSYRNQVSACLVVGDDLVWGLRGWKEVEADAGVEGQYEGQGGHHPWQCRRSVRHHLPRSGTPLQVQSPPTALSPLLKILGSWFLYGMPSVINRGDTSPWWVVNDYQGCDSQIQSKSKIRLYSSKRMYISLFRISFQFSLPTGFWFQNETGNYVSLKVTFVGNYTSATLKEFSLSLQED